MSLQAHFEAVTALHQQVVHFEQKQLKLELCGYCQHEQLQQEPSGFAQHISLGLVCRFSKDERLDSACKTACGTPE